MKKWMAIALMLMMLLTLTAAAEETINLPRVTEKNSVLYDNSYLGYSLRVWEYFTAVPDAANQDQLKLIQENEAEDDDHVYDVRYWVVAVTENEYMTFCVQLKERSCETFEQEVANAAVYAEIANAKLPEDGSLGHYENVHEGILRDTPAGQMLETAYRFTDAQGKQMTVVYYDFYYNTIEYCFVLENESSLISVETMQQLLGDMMSTISVQNVISEV